MNNKEVTVESLTFEQFLQNMKQPGSVQGTPVGTARVVERRSPVPGVDLLKQRICVTFVFAVTVNDSAIRSSSNDDTREHELALLRQFLIADKERLEEMLAYQAGLELGLNSSESFIEMFMSQIDFAHGVFEHRLLSPAIDALAGEEKQWWQEIRDQPKDREHGDILSLYTEDLFECFKAEFVSSSYKLLPSEQEKPQRTKDTITCDVFLSRLNALQTIAKRELDNNGTSEYLLTIANGIIDEAKDMAELLTAKIGA